MQTLDVNASDLSGRLVSYTVAQLEELVSRHFPGYRIPRVFAGHRVNPDVAADLVFTLGLLHESGVEVVADTPVDEAISTVLRSIDGPNTNTFFSYRVAETLGRFGSFGANGLLAGFSAAEKDNVAEACDSSATIAALDRREVPRNYAAVLARCELARQVLGLLPEDNALSELVDRVAEMLATNPGGWLDDSHTGIGRYDIYTADVYLFTLPLAERLGAVWERGARNAAGLVAAAGARNGAGVTWGRSLGALATCLTIEFAGLVLSRSLCEDTASWITRAASAFDAIPDWFRDGLITAHQYRSTFRYRGPFRRLQMTLDCLGKLADSALMLRGAEADSIDSVDVFGDRDEVIHFEEARPVGVWAYRTRDLAFSLPIVGSTLSDYLPAPRNPGLFEVPVDADLPSGVPVVFAGGKRYVSGHVPSKMRKRPDAVDLVYDGFPQSRQWEFSDDTPVLAGRRTVSLHADGRTLRGVERIELNDVPDAVSMQICETASRPLRVEFECDVAHAATAIDTAGLAEYRSFWSELPVVHQIDIEPARVVNLSWTVTPKLRVASTARDHHYHRSLYDPLSDRVHDIQFPYHLPRDVQATAELLRNVDQFHLHWPEWFLGPNPAHHERFIAQLKDATVKIVWTQHNLEPHSKDERYADAYAMWAQAADAVIHHTDWGRGQVTARYAFRPDALHRVLAHGHFGNLMHEVAVTDRASVERELGLGPCKLRLGIVGAPRAEKNVQLVLDAFAACGREDLQLLVLSLGGDETVPDDDRITALPYEFVPRGEYNRRLAAIDVFVLPFAAEGMLGTGTVGDAIALGRPAIVSDWGYLHEALGGAGISYGSTAEDLTALLDGLDEATVAAAARAAVAIREETEWARIAEEFFELLEELGTEKL